MTIICSHLLRIYHQRNDIFQCKHKYAYRERISPRVPVVVVGWVPTVVVPVNGVGVVVVPVPTVPDVVVPVANVVVPVPTVPTVVVPVPGVALVVLAVVPVNCVVVPVPTVGVVTAGVVPVPTIVEPVNGVTVNDTTVPTIVLAAVHVPLSFSSVLPVPEIAKILCYTSSCFSLSNRHIVPH